MHVYKHLYVLCVYIFIYIFMYTYEYIDTCAYVFININICMYMLRILALSLARSRSLACSLALPWSDFYSHACVQAPTHAQDTHFEEAIEEKSAISTRTRAVHCRKHYAHPCQQVDRGASGACFKIPPLRPHRHKRALYTRQRALYHRQKALLSVTHTHRILRRSSLGLWCRCCRSWCRLGWWLRRCWRAWLRLLAGAAAHDYSLPRLTLSCSTHSLDSFLE